MEICPLCKNSNIGFFFEDKYRVYLQCQSCFLVFVNSSYYLSSEEEKSRYLLHHNSIEDTPYVEFLSKSIIPLISVSNPGHSILDFGSGPTPVLSEIIRSMGLSIDIYDPFFNNDTTVFSKQYQAIVSTEVFEHITDLASTITRLWELLESSGSLIIQTSLYPSVEKFKGWGYKNDMTHICFFSLKSFLWMKNYLGAAISLPEPNVAVFQKL